MNLDAALNRLTDDERRELDALLAMEAGWEPLPGPQTQALDSPADILLYGGAAGGGKGLALDTPLPTPTGWTTMGAVSPGDWLLDADGQPCAVTAVSPVQLRACFRLRFDDGSEIVADDVHRWITFDAAELAQLTRRAPEWKAARRAARESRAAGRKSAAFSAAIAARNRARAAAAPPAPPPAGTLRDTRAIAATLRTAAGRANHAIRVAAPLELPPAALPIPPYVLGAWLGDGSSRNAQLTGQDAEVWERIEAEGFAVRHYGWSAIAHNILGLLPRLRAAGLLGNKHVPPAYLRAAPAQRLALLQGLMDTDGHAAPDGRSEFDNTRRALAEAVYELATSLGIKATMREGTATLDGRATGPKWRVAFTTAAPVFSMARKLARLRPETRRTAAFRYIVACEPVAPVPTRCIAVASPARMFLAGRAMIPTHNTDLILGAASTRHKRSIIFRREYPQLQGIIDRGDELFAPTRLNGGKMAWLLSGGRKIEVGAVQHLGDEQKYQGRPHDLKAFDELTHFAESQFRFLIGWLRSDDPAQRKRVICASNPPTSSEGDWVITFWAPWLDPHYAGVRALPGELRWYTTLNGVETEVPDGSPFVHAGETVYPESRTFIPARVQDNPYLMQSGYVAKLQALPEPLRSKMLYGDFLAGREDAADQVIPTEWVRAAQARWIAAGERPRANLPMSALGVDVARGGADSTVLSPRHGEWMDRQIVMPGESTPDGPSVARAALIARRDQCPLMIDVIGVGASVYDALKAHIGSSAVAVNGSEGCDRMDKTGQLGMRNMRAWVWWHMRELLDPESGHAIALPPDQALLSDLCAPRWKMTPSGIQIESKDDIIKRIGRSPDRGDSACYAFYDPPRMTATRAIHSGFMSR